MIRRFKMFLYRLACRLGEKGAIPPEKMERFHKAFEPVERSGS